MKFIKTVAEREKVYQALVAKYGYENVQPIELRLENKLLNNVSDYKFKVLETEGAALECEKRLNNNDQMVVMEIGYGLYERNSSTADAAIKWIQKYPNVNAFTTSVGTFNKAHLVRAWNGDLSIRRGTKVDLEALPLRLFYEAAVTQQASATTFSSESAESAGKRVSVPRLILRGNQQLEIKTTYAPFATVAWQQDTANLDIMAVLLFTGFVVKGQNDDVQVKY